MPDAPAPATAAEDLPVTDGHPPRAGRTRRRWPSWAPWALVGFLVLARVVAIGALLASGIEDEHSVLGGDARRYELILSNEGTPYRDHEVEYPPAALGLMKLVLRPSILQTLGVLAATQLALELATAAVLAWAWSRRAALVYLLLGTTMLFFPFPYVRIDLLSVFLAVLGLALLRRARDRWAQAAGGVVLAVSVFAKLWPLVTAPVMVLRRQTRGLAAWVLTGLAGLLAWVVWAGADGLEQILTFRGADGWQIESLPGLVLHTLDADASTVQEGAWRTAVPAPAPVRTALSIAGLMVVALTWWMAARATRPRPPTTEEVPTAGLSRDDLVLEALAPLAAVLAMLISSSIISPQYVLWFLPFAALAAARGDRLIGWLSAAVAFLSMLGLGLIKGLITADWHAVTVVGLRNALLVALLVVTLGRLRSLARPPGRPGAPAVPAA